MSIPLVECVPNFSEGRRSEIIRQLVKTVVGTPGVRLLDQHSDPDHNRTVLTFVGSPEAVETAAFAATAQAAQLIDLNQHVGQHPRIGATDVIPFIPLQGLTLADCVNLARHLGSRLAEELGLPVYLYEAAAVRPGRANLEDIRRGEYEGLKGEIGTNPDRRPDFGPAQLGPAGATVVGARRPLVAYNVYLDTPDAEIAKKIARAVRGATGGLRNVKALGLLVEGRAQVSMNLTDYTQTSIARACEMVRREAAHWGTRIVRGEIVGLVPEAALLDAAAWYLQLEPFAAGQVIENRLGSTGEGNLAHAEQSFLQDLASGEPTPGGGSAAALAAAMAAALVGMVARLTAGRNKYAGVREDMLTMIQEADALRARMEEAVREDSLAFEQVLHARRLPSGNDLEQELALRSRREALLHAAQIPFEVCQHAFRLLELAGQAAEMGLPSAASDVGTAGFMASAALRSAGLNVRINLLDLPGDERADQMRHELEQIEAGSEAALKSLQSRILPRVSIRP
ncbi:MAG: glutamate formimidoyltransferase [Anaerolineales bacterium]|jgi:glutamate formiminotransferase/formiminotetrahydrofolate cyclodeaminase